MSFRSNTLIVVLGLLASASFVADADASNRHQRHRNPGFHNHSVHRVAVRQRINVRQRVVINIDTRRHYHRLDGYRGYRGYRNVRGLNTYSGDVDINYQPGVGTWSYGAASALQTEAVAERKTVRIIDLKSSDNDCSMEKGVCVIRP